MIYPPASSMLRVGPERSKQKRFGEDTDLRISENILTDTSNC
jgi:hypothetical protein